MHTVVVLRAIRVGHIHRKVPFGIEVLTDYFVLRIEHHTVWADFVPPPEILCVHVSYLVHFFLIRYCGRTKGI